MVAPKMIHPKGAMSRVSSVSVVKEICLGIVVAMGFGSVWKWKQWQWQRDYRLFYSQLEKDEINLVKEE